MRAAALSVSSTTAFVLLGDLTAASAKVKIEGQTMPGEKGHVGAQAQAAQAALCTGCTLEGFSVICAPSRGAHSVDVLVVFLAMS